MLTPVGARRYTEDLFKLRGIDVRFSAPATDEHAKLGADVRRDVLLTFKEAANNAARHSGCSRIDIEFEVQRSQLVLVIADNGVGFETSLESSGQGLISLRRRGSV